MGLDQYAYWVDKKELDYSDNGLVIFNDRYETGQKYSQEFEYWRKYPSLHGWMEKLYIKRGGVEEFNCIPLILFREDLEELEVDILSNNLPYTKGFFFGQDADINSDDPEEQELYNSRKLKNLNFVKRARELIDRGKLVYYNSWW